MVHLPTFTTEKKTKWYIDIEYQSHGWYGLGTIPRPVPWSKNRPEVILKTGAPHEEGPTG